eukprot:615221-Rhodomonas_salina.1
MAALHPTSSSSLAGFVTDTLDTRRRAACSRATLSTLSACILLHNRCQVVRYIRPRKLRNWENDALQDKDEGVLVAVSTATKMKCVLHAVSNPRNVRVSFACSESYDITEECSAYLCIERRKVACRSPVKT